MSRRPNVFTTSATRRSAARASETSAWKATARRPSFRTAPTTASADSFPRLNCTPTSAPSFANSSTAARPMPPLPPVTRATRPSRRPTVTRPVRRVINPRTYDPTRSSSRVKGIIPTPRWATRGGSQARTTAPDLRSGLAGVRGFKSPAHPRGSGSPIPRTLFSGFRIRIAGNLYPVGAARAPKRKEHEEGNQTNSPGHTRLHDRRGRVRRLARSRGCGELHAFRVHDGRMGINRRGLEQPGPPNYRHRGGYRRAHAALRRRPLAQLVHRLRQ